MEYKDFIDLLKECRQQRGFSQAELSKKMGKSHVWASRVENHRTFLRMDDYVQLCEVLEVNPASLFKEDIPSSKFAFLLDTIAKLNTRDVELIYNLAKCMEAIPHT